MLPIFRRLRALFTRRPAAPPRPGTRVAHDAGDAAVRPSMRLAARAAAQSTGEIVVRTLRLQQLADEWRRRPSKA